MRLELSLNDLAASIFDALFNQDFFFRVKFIDLPTKQALLLHLSNGYFKRNLRCCHQEHVIWKL